MKITAKALCTKVAMADEDAQCWVATLKINHEDADNELDGTITVTTGEPTIVAGRTYVVTVEETDAAYK